MSSPNSGHTAANIALAQDGLRDGDVITSPSLTNFLEGVHGNGLVRLQDGDYNMTGRNSPSGENPGFITKTGENTFTVQGGYAVMDGVFYSFGGGPGNDQTLTIDNTLAYCNTTPLAAGQEALYVVYLCASSNAAHTLARIRIAGGTPVSQTGNVYPPIPSAFLNEPNPALGAGELNGHAVVLGVLRCRRGGVAPDFADIVEVNDKRVFVQSSAQYFTPLNRYLAATPTPATNQSIDRHKNSGVNTAAQLKEIYGAGNVENGDFGGQHGANRIDVSALWVSHQNWDTAGAVAPTSGDPDYGLGPSSGKDSGGTNTPTDVLYYSGQVNSNQGADTGGAMYTVRLGSRGVDVSTWTKGSGGTVNWKITSNGDSVFLINVATGGSVLNIDPTGEAFPEGHMVHINKSGGAGTLQFNTVAVSSYSVFVFDGNSWHKMN